MNKSKSGVLLTTIAIVVSFMISHMANAYDLIDRTGAATEEALQSTACSLYVVSDKYTAPEGTMLGSGVIVSCTINYQERIFVLTAKHVAKAIGRERGLKDLCLGLAKHGRDGEVIRVSTKLSNPVWLTDENPALDLALLDITDLCVKFEEDGCTIASVNLNSRNTVGHNQTKHSIQGSGVATENSFHKLNILPGTPALALLGSYTNDLQLTATTWKSPFTLEYRQIQVFNCLIQRSGAAYVNHLATGPVSETNSGSPVFVPGSLNDNIYPMLIGLVMQTIPPSEGFPSGAFGIMPIDLIYSVIENGKYVEFRTTP